MNDRRLTRLTLPALIGLVCLSVIGCAPSERAAPPALEQETLSPMPLATLTVVPTPTLTPSQPTPLETVTPTAARLAPGVSVEVSYEGPAGQLALVRGDGLWLVVSEPGSPHETRLVEGEDISSPRFSPDGRWPLFRRDGQPWLIPAGGGETALVSGTADHCVWSSLEGRLACATKDGGLVLHNPATQTAQMVLPAGSGVGRIAWSPDGRWLAYEKWEPLPAQGLPTYQGLWRVRFDGTQASEVFANADPVARQSLLVDWSPDGNRILFWQGLELSASLATDGLLLLSVPVGGGEPVQLPIPFLPMLTSWLPRRRESGCSSLRAAGARSGLTRVCALRTPTGAI